MKFFPTPLIEAKADILAHEPQFNMDQFARFTDERDPDVLVLEIDCGTEFCIAGSIVIRYFGIGVDEDGNPQPASAAAWDDDWEGHARKVTGMTEAEAKSVFYQWQWWKINPEFLGLEPTPKNAIIVIDEFLRQKGFSPDGQPLKGEADAD